PEDSIFPAHHMFDICMTSSRNNGTPSIYFGDLFDRFCISCVVYDRVTFALFEEIFTEHSLDVITMDRIAIAPDKENPIAIAIKGYPKICFFTHNFLLQVEQIISEGRVGFVMWEISMRFKVHRDQVQIGVMLEQFLDKVSCHAIASI